MKRILPLTFQIGGDVCKDYLGNIVPCDSPHVNMLGNPRDIANSMRSKGDNTNSIINTPTRIKSITTPLNQSEINNQRQAGIARVNYLNKEKERRKVALAADQNAHAQPFFSKERWQHPNIADETRLFNDDTDDYINPATWLGGMADGLSSWARPAPTTMDKVERGMSIAGPLLMGATGSKLNLPQFAEHSLNPMGKIATPLTYGLHAMEDYGKDPNPQIAVKENIPTFLQDKGMDSSIVGRKNIAQLLGMNNYIDDENTNNELRDRIENYQKKQLGGQILNNNNMNSNFFNQRKSLRAFQSGGTMPQREQFNSEEEYQAAIESYNTGIASVASSFTGPTDNTNQSVIPTVPIQQPQLGASVTSPSITSVTLPSVKPQQAIPGYQGASIVDFLKSVGVDSSKANRRKLAVMSGDDNYNMSGADNTALMNYVRNSMQGIDKIRNVDGNIVALEGSGQVPLTMDGLAHLNKTGTLPTAKSQKAVSKPDQMSMADMEQYLNNHNQDGSAKYLQPQSNTPFGFNNFLNNRDEIYNNANTETNQSSENLGGKAVMGALGTIGGLGALELYGAGKLKSPLYSKNINSIIPNQTINKVTSSNSLNDLLSTVRNQPLTESPPTVEEGKALLAKLRESKLIKNIGKIKGISAEGIGESIGKGMARLGRLRPKL